MSHLLSVFHGYEVLYKLSLRFSHPGKTQIWNYYTLTKQLQYTESNCHVTGYYFLFFNKDMHCDHTERSGQFMLSHYLFFLATLVITNTTLR